MATFPAIIPSYSSSKKIDATVIESQFGDGYRLRAADGLNNVAQTWDVVFENYDNADIDTIDAFLEAQKGSIAFDWTPPGDLTSKKWTCKSWNITPSGYTTKTLRASFRQEFDL